jgi:hypothetical protein
MTHSVYSGVTTYKMDNTPTVIGPGWEVLLIFGYGTKKSGVIQCRYDGNIENVVFFRHTGSVSFGDDKYREGQPRQIEYPAEITHAIIKLMQKFLAEQE